jgi:hypothetical protein
VNSNTTKTGEVTGVNEPIKTKSDLCMGRNRCVITEDIEVQDNLLDVLNRLSVILLAEDNEENLEESLLKGMELIGKCLGADSVQICPSELRGDALHFIAKYVWLSDNGKKTVNFPIKETISYPKRWIELFQRGEHISGPISELSREEQDFLSSFGVKSTVAIPLYYKNKFWGAFGVNDCVKIRHFTDKEINILNIASVMLVNAINRNLQIEESRFQLTKLDLVVSATKIGLWDMQVVQNDPANPDNAFLWSDKFMQLLGFTDLSDFPNILSSWSDRLHPDDKERTLSAFLAHMLDKTGQTPYNLEYRLQKKNGDYGFIMLPEKLCAMKAVTPSELPGI